MTGTESPPQAVPREVTAHITGASFLWHPSRPPWSVWFSTLYPRLPIYHDPEGRDGFENQGEDGSGTYRSRTKCGIVTYEFAEAPGRVYIERSERSPGYRIPHQHALKFGKPCEKCWPEITEVVREADEDA